MKRTTLQALVKRLGIDRPRFCRHVGTCRSVGSPLSSLALTQPTPEWGVTLPISGA